MTNHKTLMPDQPPPGPSSARPGLSQSLPSIASLTMPMQRPDSAAPTGVTDSAGLSNLLPSQNIVPSQHQYSPHSLQLPHIRTYEYDNTPSNAPLSSQYPSIPPQSHTRQPSWSMYGKNPPPGPGLGPNLAAPGMFDPRISPAPSPAAHSPHSPNYLNIRPDQRSIVPLDIPSSGPPGLTPAYSPGNTQYYEARDSRPLPSPKQSIPIQSSGSNNPHSALPKLHITSPSPGQDRAHEKSSTKSPTNSVVPENSIGLSDNSLLTAPSQFSRRPFRQRRKDPSCDACRERKVKCDATESSACTECITRQLKCQFTKETNRRMSTIKDLEKAVTKLASSRSEYLALLKASNIDVPQHLTDLNDIPSLTITSSQSEDMVGSISPSISQLSPTPSNSLISPVSNQYAKSPSPGYFSRRGSELPESARSPFLIQSNPPPRPLANSWLSVTYRGSTKINGTSGTVTIKHDFSHLREFLKVFNQGAHTSFTPEGRRVRWRDPFEDLGKGDPITTPQLPDKSLADELIQNYYDIYQSWLPIVSWPEFLDVYNKVYQHKSYDVLEHGSKDPWIPLLYSIMALGVVDNMIAGVGTADAIQYVKVAGTLVGVCPMAGDYCIFSIQSCVLVSVFGCESNRNSMASMWLSIAVQMAQDLGFDNPQNQQERQTWWSIFAWDRLFSIQTGRNFLVADNRATLYFPPTKELEDTKSSKPNEAYDSDSALEISSAPSGSNEESLPKVNFLSSMVHAIRTFDVIGQTLQYSSTLSLSTLGTFEAHFDTFWAVFPPSTLPDSPEKILSPGAIAPVLLIRLAKSKLQKINLSPLAQQVMRSNALDFCIVSARRVGTMFKRIEVYVEQHPIHGKTKQENWRFLVGKYCVNHVALHIWNGVMPLLAKGLYEDAKFLIKILQAASYHRPQYNRFGLFIEGMIKLLQWNFNRSPDYTPLVDEDIIALISGDLQGVEGHAWIWSKAEEEKDNRDNDEDSESDSEMSTNVKLNNTDKAQLYSSIEPPVLPWSDWDGLLTRLDKLEESNVPDKFNASKLDPLSPFPGGPLFDDSSRSKRKRDESEEPGPGSEQSPDGLSQSPRQNPADYPGKTGPMSISSIL